MTSSPAGIALDLPQASLGARLVSGLIDYLATVVLFVVTIFVFLVAALQTDAALLHVAVIGTVITVFVIYPTTMETLTRGRSLGKPRWVCAPCATTRDRFPSSTPSSGRSSASWRSTRSRERRRSSRP